MTSHVLLFDHALPLYPALQIFVIELNEIRVNNVYYGNVYRQKCIRDMKLEHEI